jgi:hypothetical protein
MMAQNVPQSARDQLLTNEWAAQQIPAKVGELLAGYDQSFRLIRAAAKAEGPCDWGLDLTEGPELLLPRQESIRFWIGSCAKCRRPKSNIRAMTPR